MAQPTTSTTTAIVGEAPEPCWHGPTCPDHLAEVARYEARVARAAVQLPLFPGTAEQPLAKRTRNPLPLPAKLPPVDSATEDSVDERVATFLAGQSAVLATAGDNEALRRELHREWWADHMDDLNAERREDGARF